jgi:histidinol phosphatase-like enzyme (inositol monophosphatase family)
MVLTKKEKNRYLKAALDTIKKTRQYIKINSKKELNIKVKKDSSVVTKADIAVENIIRKELSKNFPHHNIIGEEFGNSKNKSDFCWYIDPIDGTINFSHNVPLYGTILALYHKNIPIIGIIDHPDLDICTYAAKGLGCFCNGKRIKLKDIRSKKELDREIIATTAPYAFIKDSKLGKYEKLIRSHKIIRNINDCYGHTLAAIGSVGVMIDYHLSIWDMAATKIIIEEAGGKYIQAYKKKIDRKIIYGIICGKPKVVDFVWKILK